MATIGAAVPSLCAGDFLTADEFIRRWENEPAIKFAELIKGVVYLRPPVSIQHGELQGDIGMWLGIFRASTPGTAIAHNATTFILDDVPQPDLHLRLLPECGGGSWIEANYLRGSPELLVEVCQTSAAYDLNVKLELYREAQVQEYLAVVLHEGTILWHRLIDGDYRLIEPDTRQVFRSQIFPGLWLDGAALLAQQPARVLATLQEGLATPEHRTFVETLTQRISGG